MHSRLISGAMLLSALAASPLCLAQNTPAAPAGLSYTYAGIQFVDQSLDDGGFENGESLPRPSEASPLQKHPV